MTIYKEIIINAQTGEETKIKYTPEELKAKKESDAKAEADYLAKLAEIEAQKTARQSALEKLAALGLTEDEIRALAG